MIVTARTGIAKPGHLSDALLFTAGIVENMNSKFGVDFSINIEVGGDPNAMHLVGRFESMGDYQEFRKPTWQMLKCLNKLSKVLN